MGKCCVTEIKSNRNGKNTAQISLAETKPCDDMENCTEEPRIRSCDKSSCYKTEVWLMGYSL